MVTASCRRLPCKLTEEASSFGALCNSISQFLDAHRAPSIGNDGPLPFVYAVGYYAGRCRGLDNNKHEVCTCALPKARSRAAAGLSVGLLLSWLPVPVLWGLVGLFGWCHIGWVWSCGGLLGADELLAWRTSPASHSHPQIEYVYVDRDGKDE